MNTLALGRLFFLANLATLSPLVVLAVTPLKPAYGKRRCLMVVDLSICCEPCRIHTSTSSKFHQWHHFAVAPCCELQIRTDRLGEVGEYLMRREHDALLPRSAM